MGIPMLMFRGAVILAAFLFFTAPAFGGAIRPPQNDPRPMPPLSPDTGEAVLAAAFRLPLEKAGTDEHGSDPRAFLVFEARERILVLDPAHSRIHIRDLSGGFCGDIPLPFPGRAYDFACFPAAGVAFLLLEGTTAVGVLEADLLHGGAVRSSWLMPVDAAPGEAAAVPASEIYRQLWGASPPYAAEREGILLVLKSAAEPTGNRVIRPVWSDGARQILRLESLRRLPEYGLAVPVASSRRLLGVHGGPDRGWRLTLQELDGNDGFSLPLGPGLLPGDLPDETTPAETPPAMRCTDLRPLGGDARGRLLVSAMVGYGGDGIREAYVYRFDPDGIFQDRGRIPPSPGLLATRYICVDPGGAVWCMHRSVDGNAVEFIRVVPDESD